MDRWPSRDPLVNAELSQGPNLYRYVRNNPTVNFDPDGRQIMVCTRPVSGFPFVGRHSYLWDTTTNTSCGMTGSFGLGPTSRPGVDTGPAGAGQTCYPVPGSEGLERSVMKRCKCVANKGLWAPPINDCASTVDSILTEFHLSIPPHPRFNPTPPLPPIPANIAPVLYFPAF